MTPNFHGFDDRRQWFTQKETQYHNNYRAEDAFVIHQDLGNGCLGMLLSLLKNYAKSTDDVSNSES